MARIAVIDIGKTNAKVLAVDLASGAEETVARMPNPVIAKGLYPHHDADAVWQFLVRSLGQVGPVQAVSITTHGACAALVDGGGALALPVLDYEHAGPDDLDADYSALRPGFEETGSPRLPGGLNLGAQLFWQARRFPEAFARVRHILTLPQYVSFRLTGVAASEATSLGCHTDLWNPHRGDFSTLVDRMGWRKLFPPVQPPKAVLGPIRPDLAAATGLPVGTPVLSGIHDSNASLVPWLGGDGPRAVISTGTWMIVMALRGREVLLEARRDVLVNVNAQGEPVPTARFMAGREVDEITGGRIVPPSPDAERSVLADRQMVLPSRHPDTGPFPGLSLGWSDRPDTAEGISAAASFYAALMGAECLSLIGADGEIVVEGPFAANTSFLRMLATATDRPVIAAGAGAGTGLGAALLAGPLANPRPLPVPVLPEADPLWAAYAADWREKVSRSWTART